MSENAEPQAGDGNLFRRLVFDVSVLWTEIGKAVLLGAVLD